MKSLAWLMGLRLLILLYYGVRVFLAEVDEQLTSATTNPSNEENNNLNEDSVGQSSLSSKERIFPKVSDKVYNCPLCLDEIRQPAVIPCGHMGCWKCLMSYALKTPTSTNPSQSLSSNPSTGYRPKALIKCPVCRYEFLCQKIRPLIL